MSLISSENFENLQHEYSLILLFNRRNKNQHRVAIWWKYFNILKRHLNMLITDLSIYDKNPSVKLKQAIISQARHLKYNIVKKCYWAFNGIVALGQFIGVGLTLIGILAKVNYEIGEIKGLDDGLNVTGTKKIKIQNPVVDTMTETDLGEEIGEVVTVEQDTKKRVENEPATLKNEEKIPTDLFSVQKKKRKKVSSSSTSDDTEKKKKKKKKKSAIDDIFG